MAFARCIECGYFGAGYCNHQGGEQRPPLPQSDRTATLGGDVTSETAHRAAIDPRRVLDVLRRVHTRSTLGHGSCIDCCRHPCHPDCPLAALIAECEAAL